jgi:hypothetical protein
MVISNLGIWAKLQSALQSPRKAVQPTGSEADQPLTGSVPVTLSGGSSAPGSSPAGPLGNIFGSLFGGGAASGAATTAADVAPLLLV